MNDRREFLPLPALDPDLVEVVVDVADRDRVEAVHATAARSVQGEERGEVVKLVIRDLGAGIQTWDPLPVALLVEPLLLLELELPDFVSRVIGSAVTPDD